VVEGASDFAILTTDLNGLIKSWSSGAEKILGWSATEAVGRHACMIFTPADNARQVSDDEMRTAAERGRAEDERWHVRQDGSCFWASGLMMRSLDEQTGEHVGYLMVLRDRTREHEAIERVRASEEFNSKVLQSSADCIKVLDLDARLLFMSEGGMCTMEVDDFGVIEGACWTDFWVGDEHARAVNAVEEAKRGDTGRFQGFAKTRKGTPRWWDVIVTPVRGPDGRPEKLLSVSRDITGTKLAEVELERRSTQLQQLAEVATHIARAVTLEARLDELTHVARRIIGAHQGVISLTRGPDWAQAINTVALSAKYEKWRDYTSAPDGSGIYAWVCEENRPVRLRQAELEAHPRWRGFGPHAKNDPPMRGWLAAPLIGRDGRNLGLIQLSDKEDGTEFDEADEAMLVQLAQLASAAVEQSQADAALRESEARLRKVIEAETVGVVFFDFVGGILEANDAFLRLIGHTREELEAGEVRYERLTPPDWRWRDEKTIAELKATGKAEPFEKEYMRRDGSRMWIFCADKRLDEHTAVEFIIDVTERRRADEALRETSRRLDAILNNTREAVFLMNDRQHCVFANAAAEKLTGYSFDEMQGRPLHDLVHHKRPDGSDYPIDECPIDRAFPERAQMSGEELFVHKDHSFYPVAFTASPMLDQAGQPVGTVIEARNIADEKAARERLAQLASVVEQSRDFIGVVDCSGRTVYLNEAGRAMVGLPNLDAARAVRLLDYFAESNREQIRTEALPAAKIVGYWEGEVSFRRFDERGEFPVLYNIFPVRDEGGTITHYATVTRDLSEQKRTEAELRVLNATLETRVEERTRELMAAEEQLRQAQKMEAVGQLTGGIAHDFNNLLTGVIGSLDMMQRRLARGETDRIERYATAAITSANRAAALTHRLLAFSRRQPLDPKSVNANRLVTGMEELLRRTIGEAIRLEIITAGGLWQTLCDPHQLESAILNLVINARDAMPEGGKLTIETCNVHLQNDYAAMSRDVRPGQYICICVTDTGTGMDKATIDKAFEPFFTTKPIGQGTGLGLSMIYGFARQSDGYAKIYSEVGQGTTLKLYLPRYYGEGDEGGETSDSLPEAHHAGNGEVVLVVEDETAVRLLVINVLEELGYSAVEASDGLEGLKLLQSNIRVDLLVTDVGLPGLNGRQLADAARQHRPDLKVLFMTGYAENAMLANGVLEPGMQMIIKPFAIEALATRIRQIIET
jgi:PAS domain S-box-containing protein